MKKTLQFFAFALVFRPQLNTLLMLSLLLPASVLAQLPLIFNAGTDGCPDDVQAYSNFTTLDIAQTSYDDVYQTECAAPGTRTFVIRDPQILPGNVYTAYLHFAEIYHGSGNPNQNGGDGSRIFSVEINGVTILDSLDIHKEVGPSEALVYRADVWVGADSAVTIKFIATQDFAKISALELYPFGEMTAFPPDNAIRNLNAVSLPVEWGLFDLHTLPDGTLNLTWTTLQEENTASFEVEASLDGVSFEALGSRPAAGFSETVQQYDFQAPALTPGRYVFRIKQVDIDGQYSYSPRREWLVGGEQGLATARPFPNPARDQATVQYIPSQNGILRLRLLSLDGREVRRYPDHTLRAASLAEVTLDLQALPSGLYILALEAAGERTHHRLRVQ